MTSNNHLLRAVNLAKQYKSRQVVKDVSLDVRSGEVVGLLGPNGAGKTTSFYMMVGLVQSDQGQILLDDMDITSQPIHVRAKHGLSYLPQEASIFRKLSVEENILSILELSKQSKEEQNERLETLINEFGLSHIRKSLGASLSGGERRRVEIARTLATNPKFILLDEPFAGIDPISVVDIKNVIHQLQQKGIGILITDHNVRETLDICERAYIVNSGEIIAEGDASHLLAHPQVRKVYLGEAFTL